MSAHAFSAQPSAQGLYDPTFEHDACGVALVATMRGHGGHDIVDAALLALTNLDHRVATGADPHAVHADAGLLADYQRELDEAGVERHWPEPGGLASTSPPSPTPGRGEEPAGRGGRGAEDGEIQQQVEA